MLNTKPTKEEQQQINSVLIRWNKYYERFNSSLVWFLLIIASTSFLLLYFGFLMLDLWILILLPAVLLGVFTLPDRIYQLSIKHFAKKLSTKEKFALHKFTSQHTWSDEEKNARCLASIFLREVKFKPDKEYLRPSQQSQDETLLRAAASTDTTPQEQLPRPSQTIGE